MNLEKPSLLEKPPSKELGLDKDLEKKEKLDKYEERTLEFKKAVLERVKESRIEEFNKDYADKPEKRNEEIKEFQEEYANFRNFDDLYIDVNYDRDKGYTLGFRYDDPGIHAIEDVHFIGGPLLLSPSEGKQLMKPFEDIQELLMAETRIRELQTEISSAKRRLKYEMERYTN